MELSGHVALVTGAQQGIGAATARALAAAGAAVVVNVLDDEVAGNEVVIAIEAAGGRAVIARGSVTDRDALVAMIASGEELGGVDLLVNNAGVFPRVPFLQLDDDDWNGVLDVNLGGAFRATQLLARTLVADGRPGAVVNLASVAAYRPSPRGAHYAASKAGLLGLTRAAAGELAPHGIRVNAVAPGITDTAQPRYGLSEDEIATASAAVPLGAMATPADIAEVIVFLLSEKARHVTGQVLHANGGAYFG